MPKMIEVLMGVAREIWADKGFRGLTESGVQGLQTYSNKAQRKVENRDDSKDHNIMVELFRLGGFADGSSCEKLLSLVSVTSSYVS